MITHASIVPLIGGSTIAQEQVFGSKPRWLLSYKPFYENDQNIVNYYGNVFYGLVDSVSPQSVDVVSTICPCAGLSSLNPHASIKSETNNWMLDTAEYVLTKVRPQVFWGENAPRLGTAMGKPIVDRLKEIGKKNNYTMMIYKTKSVLHGLSQVRDRVFYFFFKGNEIPIFNYYRRPLEPLENCLIDNPAPKSGDPMTQLVTNTRTPSDDPFYAYLLNVVEGGISHIEYAAKIDRSVCVMHEIETSDHTYLQVRDWLTSQDRFRGMQPIYDKCERMHEKLSSGKNIMRKGIIVPKDLIGAFIGHLPFMMAHPLHDRFLTIRECLNIMKMPPSFQLVNHKNVNHICQNVPVTTAMHMCYEIKKYLEGKAEIIKRPFGIINNKNKTIEWMDEPASLESFL